MEFGAHGGRSGVFGHMGDEEIVAVRGQIVLCHQLQGHVPIVHLETGI